MYQALYFPGAMHRSPVPPTDLGVERRDSRKRRRAISRVARQQKTRVSLQQETTVLRGLKAWSQTSETWWRGLQAWASMLGKWSSGRHLLTFAILLHNHSGATSGNIGLGLDSSHVGRVLVTFPMGNNFFSFTLV